MKKTIILLISVLLGIAVCFSSCESVLPAEEENSSSETEQNRTENSDYSAENNLPEYTPGSVKLVSQNSDNYPFERKYRMAYYRIWGEFSDLLSEEEYSDYQQWTQNVSEENGYGEFQNEMLLVSFVKRYGISREEFDAAAQKYTENSKRDNWDMLSEEFEVPNGDIIYTFDNEIINNYYRYE